MFIKKILFILLLLTYNMTAIIEKDIASVISDSTQNEISVGTNASLVTDVDKVKDNELKLIEAIENVEKKLIPAIKEYVEAEGINSISLNELKTQNYISDDLYNKVNGKINLTQSSGTLSITGFENILDTVDGSEEELKSLWCNSNKHLSSTNLTCNSSENKITITPQKVLSDLDLESGESGVGGEGSGEASVADPSEPVNETAAISNPTQMNSEDPIERQITPLQETSANITNKGLEEATKTEKDISSSSPGVVTTSKTCPYDYSASQNTSLGECQKEVEQSNTVTQDATRETWTCSMKYKDVETCTTSRVSYSCTNSYGCADTCYKNQTTCTTSQVEDGYTSNPSGFESKCPSTAGDWKCEATVVNGRTVVGSSLSGSTCTYDLEKEYLYASKECDSNETEQNGSCVKCDSGWSSYSSGPLKCQKNICNTNWTIGSNGSCYQCQSSDYPTLLISSYNCEASSCGTTGLEEFGGECYDNCPIGTTFDSGICIKDTCENNYDWELIAGNNCQKKECELGYFQNEETTCCENGTIFNEEQSKCLTLCPVNYSENNDNTCCPSNTSTDITEYLNVNGSMKCVTCPIGTTFDGSECVE